METTDCSNIAISPPIESPFSIEWSLDNQISILSQKGIHIFELIPSPFNPNASLKFSRSFIYPPKNVPSENLLEKVNNKIWDMKRQEVYSLMMEEHLTPKLPEVSEIFPKIIKIAWSPRNLADCNKCLLAIVTSSGAALVLVKVLKHWFPVYDLSASRTVLENTKAEDTHATSFSSLSSMIKSQQASAIAWSELFDGHAYVCVAYGNVDLVIYKLSTLRDSEPIMKPEIVNTIKLNTTGKVTVLRWFTLMDNRHLIVVGYLDGRVYAVRSDPSLSDYLIVKYYERVDRVAVSSVLIISQQEIGVRVFVSKGIHLILFSLTKAGCLESTKWVQLPGFSISGLTSLDQSTPILTTENGFVFTVNCVNNKLVLQAIENHFPKMGFRYLGLGHSPNHVIFVNVMSPNTTYDHLVIKEPSKVCFFWMEGEKWDSRTILHSGAELERLWDCMEAIRVRATKGMAGTVILPTISADLESQSLRELRISMWITGIGEACQRKKGIQGMENITGEISEAQPLIFIMTACHYLERLLAKPTFTTNQKISLNSLRMYLEVHLAGEDDQSDSPITQRVIQIVKLTSELNFQVVESCNLCGIVLEGLPWQITRCPSGHVLPRCAITLLQMTDVQYRTCPICGLIFHPSLDEEYGETRCLYCDVICMKDNRVTTGRISFPIEKSCSIKSSEERERERTHVNEES